MTHLDYAAVTASFAVAWFYRLLRNAVIDHYRRRAAQAAALERFALELADTVLPPDVAVAIRACVTRLAGTLKPEVPPRPCWAVIDGQGLAQVKDYAAQQGLTAGNAGVRVFRARQALRLAGTAPVRHPRGSRLPRPLVRATTPPIVPSGAVLRYDGVVTSVQPTGPARAAVLWRDFRVAFGQVWEGYARTPPSC